MRTNNILVIYYHHGDDNVLLDWANLKMKYKLESKPMNLIHFLDQPIFLYLKQIVEAHLNRSQLI